MEPFSAYSGSETHIRIDPSVTSIPDRAFEGNKKLVEVELPAGLEAIGKAAFLRCTSLKRITLYEGLQTIGALAFSGCTSLLQVYIPSTVHVIAESTFNSCSSLNQLHLCEGICSIGDLAFQDCLSLKKVSIPSTAKDIGESSFSDCLSLKEVQLCESLSTIGHLAMYDCVSLLRLNIPSSFNFIDVEEDYDEFIFLDFPLLRNVVISPSSTLGYETLACLFRNVEEVDCTFDMLKCRFDDLPLHEICYFHSNQLMESLSRWSSVDFLAVDCLGMTPLHVLACSGEHDLSLYRRICEICPDAMVVQDKWGETPLGYILLSEAPEEVIHFFLDTHKKTEGGIPLDFSRMVFRLVIFAYGEKYLRQVIQAQRTHFPDDDIDWQFVIQELHVSVSDSNQLDLNLSLKPFGLY